MDEAIKKGAGLFAFIFIMVLSVNFASASSFQLGSVGDFVQKIIDSIAEIGKPVFGALFGVYQSDEFLFMKVLLFVLLFVMIKVALKATPGIGDNKGLVNIISTVISLFAIRFISETEFVRGVLLPYGVLGVALVTLLPFLIYFFFVHKAIPNSTGRKVAWILYIVILFIIWIGQSSKISSISNYIYLAVFVLALLLLFFDKNVRKYFAMGEIREMEEHINADHIARAVNEYREAVQAYQATGGNNRTLRRLVERRARQLRNMGVEAN